MEDSESSSNEGSKDNRVESDFPLTRLFEQLCPIYMLYGMTYDEYWHGDSYRALFYRRSYKLKMEQEYENMNFSNWNQGLYFYEALCCASPILHAFAKKGTKPLPYSSKPYGTDKSKETEAEPTEQEIKNERMRAQIFFSNWARSTAKHFENK